MLEVVVLLTCFKADPSSSNPDEKKIQYIERMDQRMSRDVATRSKPRTGHPF